MMQLESARVTTNKSPVDLQCLFLISKFGGPDHRFLLHKTFFYKALRIIALDVNDSSLFVWNTGVSFNTHGSLIRFPSLYI